MAIERRNIPCPDAPTLQRRIQSARPGEVLELGEGTLEGGIVIDRPLVLRGRGAGLTVLDGMAREPVIAIDADGPVILEGLTIANGRGPFGAGVSIDNGPRVELRGCLVEANLSRSGRGGGVALDRGHLVISECTLAGNKAFQGGAIFAGGEARIEVAASMVCENLAMHGGAIAAVDGAEVELWTSRFEANRAQIEGHHLFLYASRSRQSRAVLSNSILGGGAGGGLAISNHPHFRASLILDNSMVDRGGLAGRVRG